MSSTPAERKWAIAGENQQGHGAHPASLSSSQLGSDGGADTGQPEWQRSELLDLAYEEYCDLVEQGGEVDLDEFCGRFPGLENSVRRQIEIHKVIQDRPSLFQECCDVLWPHPGDHVLDFQLIDEMGRGAFSRVFRAADTVLGERQVVVKVCHSGTHEAWILGKLDHENIVPIHSIRPDMMSGLSVICMPYLGRTTLRDVIASAWKKNRSPVRASEILLTGQSDDRRTGKRQSAPSALQNGVYSEGVIFIGAKIAQALAHAHSEDILHLDLKPSNVLIDESGCPKILDFNLSSDSGRSMPPVGGTPPYMSPEQAERFLSHEEEVALDPRSDIFSLGVVLHEMLCGELPYDQAPQAFPMQQSDGGTLEPDFHKHLQVKWTRGQHGRLGNIIERCLAIDPDERYQSADELAVDLQHELSLARRSKRWVRTHRRTLLATIGAVTLLSLGMATGLAMRDPLSVRAYQKGIAYLAEGEYEKAIEQLNISLDDDPEQPDAQIARTQKAISVVCYEIGIRYLTEGEYDKAIELLEDSLNADPSHPEALNARAIAISISSYHKGIAALDECEYEQAIDQLSISLDADPNQPDALFAHGRAFVGTDKYKDAFDDLEASNEMVPDGRKCALAGYCCNRLRSHAEAATWYKRSLIEGPRSSAVLHNLGATEYKRNHLESAIQAFDEAVELGDRPMLTLRNRAIVHRAVAFRENSLPEKAMQDILEVIARGDKSALVYYHAAIIFEFASQFVKSHEEEAVFYLNRSIQNGAPVEFIESDPALSRLLNATEHGNESRNNDHTFAPRTDFFVNPIE